MAIEIVKKKEATIQLSSIVGPLKLKVELSKMLPTLNCPWGVHTKVFFPYTFLLSFVLF